MTLRKLIEEATPGEIEIYTSNSYRRIGLRRNYKEIIYPVRSAGDGHPDLGGPNLAADLALIEHLWNRARLFAELRDAADLVRQLDDDPHPGLASWNEARGDAHVRLRDALAKLKAAT